MIKFLAQDIKTTIYHTGGVGISFDTTINAQEELQKLKRGDYLIEIKKPSNKRSLNQNAYLWEMIGQISMKENGNRTADESIYANILQMAGAKVDYIQGLPEVEETLKKFYRVVIVAEKRTNEKGVETHVYKCYRGTSEMDTKEMSLVIDKALEYATQVGLDSAYWSTLLKEE